MTVLSNDVLDRAIAERANATLSVPGETDREWQIRLAQAAADQDGMWVQPMDDPHRVLDDFIAHGIEMKVAIGFDRSRYVFLTQLLKRNKHLWLNQATMVEAVLLRYPAEVSIEDRRAHPRLPVPDGSNVAAQIVCGSALLPISVKVWDVSEGGLALLCPRDTNVLALKRGDRFAFTLTEHGRKMAGSAQMCFSRPLSAKILKIGAQFVPETLDATSQETLAHLLGELTRIERLRGRGRR
ncbi:MAG TPA: PilZ domain-containing protein [Tepidisphaeraceae bacterium]|nr:PilZ domain-containing protein [Tepidisphaeraceae bacterium]